jgi:hypothetical protein
VTENKKEKKKNAQRCSSPQKRKKTNCQKGGATAEK